MADVNINAALSANSTAGDVPNQWSTSPSILYSLMDDGTGSDLIMKKSTDKGATWTEQDAANSPGANLTSAASCADWDTPGDSGTLIHVAWLQTSDDELHYITFDTAADTWGTDRTIDALTVSATVTSSDVAITKAKSGRVYVAGRGDFAGDTENTDHSMLSSTDNFATAGTAETSPYSSDEEIIKFFPGADADTNDICAVVFAYHLTGFALEFWKYDDSAGTWGVTTIDRAMDNGPQDARLEKTFFSASLRHSDQHVLVVYFNTSNSRTGDFKSADIAQAVPTIRGKTDLHSNVGSSLYSAVTIDQISDDVYVAYCGSDDGSESLFSAVTCFYKLSTDGMREWGSEAAYGVRADDLRGVWSPNTITSAGGRFMPQVGQCRLSRQRWKRRGNSRPHGFTNTTSTQPRRSRRITKPIGASHGQKVFSSIPECSGHCRAGLDLVASGNEQADPDSRDLHQPDDGSSGRRRGNADALYYERKHLRWIRGLGTNGHPAEHQRLCCWRNSPRK